MRIWFLRSRGLMLLGLFLVLSYAGVQTAPVQAQEGPTFYTFCYDFSSGVPYTDLSTGITVDIYSEGFPLGSFDNSFGNPSPSITSVAVSEDLRRSHIIITFPSPASANGASFDTYFSDSYAATAYLYYFDGSETPVVDLSRSAGFGSSWNTQDSWGDGGDNIESVQMLIEQHGGANWIDNVCINTTLAPTPGLQKPLTDADFSPSIREGLFDTSDYIGDEFAFWHSDPYMVVALSNQPGNDVYAVADGQITEMKDPNTFSCEDAGLYNWLNTGVCLLGFDPTPGGLTDDDHIYRVDTSNAYLVKVTFRGDGEELSYLVEQAPDYVMVGDFIHAGCILGKTTELFGYQIYVPLPGGGSLGSSQATKGVAFVTLFTDATDTASEPLVDMLTEPTDPGQACNAIPELATCMGTNPHFLNNGDGWSVRGLSLAEWIPGGGVSLAPGGEVFTNLNLNGDTAYTVTAGGLDTVLTDSSVLLRIGTQSDSFTVDDTTETVALEDITPAGGTGVYEVGLKNVGSGAINVGWLCVTDGAPPENPSSCYFPNNSFDMDATSWTVGSSIFLPGDGTAMMLDDSNGTLMQSVNLPAGDYTLSARVRPFYVSGSVPIAPNLVTAPSGNLDLLYDFNGSTGLTVGSVVYSGTDPGWMRVATTFTLSSQTDDSMTFYLNINSGSEELAGLNIDRFCLERTGGYTPPGTGYPPIVNPSCEVVANPLSTDVPTWISWHWAQLNRFFTCDLMVLLNNQYLYLRTTGDTALKTARYFIVSVQYQASWFGSQLLPWLGGYLNNISLGRTTIIATENQQCDNIFCAIVAGYQLGRDLIDRVLGIIQVGIDFLNDVARAVFSIFLSLFGRAVGLVTNVAVGADRFVNAWNHANQPIDLTGDPLLPDGGSQTPTETANSFLDRFNTWVASTACGVSPRTKPGCITLWLFENTIFSGDRKVIVWFICANALGGWWYWSIRRGKAIVEKLARNL